MKFTIEGMEVEIKVKGQHSSRANKEDAIYLMNLMSIYAGLAGDHYSEKFGIDGLAKEAYNIAGEIFEQLHKMGAYENL